MQRDLLGPSLQVALLPPRQVGLKPPERLGGQLARRTDIRRRVEHHATRAVARSSASAWPRGAIARWRDRPGTLGELRATVSMASRRRSLRPCVRPCRCARVVIPRGVLEQILEAGGRVVGGRTVMTHDALLVGPLEARLEPEAGDAVQVDRDEVQPRRGHLHGQSLEASPSPPARSDAFRPVSERW